MLTTKLQNLLNERIEIIEDERVEVLNVEINEWENYGKHRIYVEIETGNVGDTSRYIKLYYELKDNEVITTGTHTEKRRYNEDTMDLIVETLKELGTQIVNDALGIEELTLEEEVEEETTKEEVIVKENGEEIELEEVKKIQEERLNKRQTKKNLTDAEMQEYRNIVNEFNKKALELKTEKAIRKALEDIKKLATETRSEDRTKSYVYLTISKSYIDNFIK